LAHYFDEDDIRDNWEDYSEIEADEDGDMDEIHLIHTSKKLKDDSRDAVQKRKSENLK
jgi:hypothetical protein